jgi:uncharacterized protein (TIGR03083 family)
MTGDEILEHLEDERERLLETLDDLSDEQLLLPGVMGDWSVKDILAHLAMWEAELVKILWSAQQGQAPRSSYFSGVPVDEINENWRKLNTSRSLDHVLSDLRAVRKQTTRRLESFSDQDLNTPARFSWLKGGLLGEWIAEWTYQHESEHTTQIQQWREGLG